jgi:hypothetical protein
MWEKAFVVEYACGGNEKRFGGYEDRDPKLKDDLEG